MPQATYIHEGEAIDCVLSVAVEAGDVVEIGERVLVAKTAIPAGKLGALATGGVFDVAKVARAIAAGATVYWDSDATPVGGEVGSGAAIATST